MIRRVLYKDIDFEKYEQCFENSAQRKYSASRDFLDIVTNKQWDLLIYNDYEAVMPVPYHRKYILKIVDRPLLCQQLGIFSKTDSLELNKLFINFLVKNYYIRHYSFSAHNEVGDRCTKRKNYFIKRNVYQNVWKTYSPKRRRKINQGYEKINNINITYAKTLSKDSKKFIFKHFKGVNSQKKISQYIQLFEKFAEYELMYFLELYDGQQLINMLAVYKDCNTVVLLGTFNDPQYVKFNGASILIDEVIKNNIINIDFDFEGSELPNVDEFFRGFGPSAEYYSVLSFSLTETLRNEI